MDNLLLQNSNEGNLETAAKLTPKQIVAISHIISGSNMAEVCKNVNISNSTLYEWMKIPEFKGELDRQRKDLIDYSLGKLKSTIGKAVDKLEELLESENEYVARGAACDILEYAIRIRELEDVANRLEKVERVILERRTYGYK